MQKKIKLVVVCGKCCSGKTTFAKEQFPGERVIDIGDIVRGLIKQEVRAHNSRLMNNIINELRFKVVSSQESTLIVTGIRQKEIYEELLDITDDIHTYWLEVSERTLKRRFLARNAVKDSMLTFESVIKKDDELGLGELERYLKDLKTTRIYKNDNQRKNDTKSTVQKRQKIKVPKVVR